MSTIIGTAQADTLKGTAADDLIDGLAGNDTILEDTGGADTIRGGEGDDTISVFRYNQVTSSATVRVEGGIGDDVISVQNYSFPNYSSGQAAYTFQVLGGDGDDSIQLSGMNITVDAGSGNDRILLSSGAMSTSATLTTGSGSDTIAFSTNGTLYGSQAVVVVDFATGTEGDRLDLDGLLAKATTWDQTTNPFSTGHLSLTQVGSDTVVYFDADGSGGSGTPYAAATLQNVQVTTLKAFNFGGYSPDGSSPISQVIEGTVSADRLLGGAGADTIQGNDGDDIITGGSGNDEIFGDAGNDILDGGLGSDEVHGGAGADTIVDDAGQQAQLYGDDGDDIITLTRPQSASGVVQHFSAIVSGGDGNDRISVDGISYNGDLTGAVDGGAGADVINIGSMIGTVDAGAGDDRVFVRSSGPGALTVTLGLGSDVIGLLDASYPSSGRITSVTDFAVGSDGDLVDVLPLLRSTSNWDFSTNPFATGHFTLAAGSGGSADFSFDRDGTSGSSFSAAVLFRFQNLSTSSFSAFNFSGYAPDGNAPAAVTFVGGASADNFIGGLGSDLIQGLDGNDRLRGGYGSDRLEGGSGNDDLNGDEGSDYLDGGAGDDLLIDNVQGNDTLLGGDGKDVLTVTRPESSLYLSTSTLLLDGGADDDLISVQANPAAMTSAQVFATIRGGAGDDRIQVGGNTGGNLDAGSGNDKVSFVGGSLGGTLLIALGSGQDTISIPTGDYIYGARTVSDFQVGEAGDVLQLSSFVSSPFLAGQIKLVQQGAHTAVQLSNGNTVVTLQNVMATDLSAFNLGGFASSIFSPSSKTITGTSAPDNLVGGDGADLINGAGGDDVLAGAGGADRLDGGSGNDTMRGGTGDDTFIIDSVGDEVAERPGEGIDTALTFISYSLAAGQSIETLTTAANRGTLAIDLTGNEYGQKLVGNFGNNVLDGKGGADILVGLAGDDTYYVDDAGDQVTESVGEGSDKVLTSTSYTLTSNQEIETLSVLDRAGTLAIDLTGNQFGNMLLGNAGNNVLNGNAGADTMTGFGGDDTYVVDSQGDQVIEEFGQGNDTLLTYVSYALSNGQEVETLSTVANRDTAAIDLLGNDYGNRLVGNFGDNYLNGRGGADTMVGLRGNDTYVIDNAGDQVIENAGEGFDQAFTFVNYALTAGQEIEALSTANQRGTTGLSLSGNEYAQTLTGDFGNNLLDGKGGADTLIGLAGDDTYIVDSADDHVVENRGEGNDTVRTTVSYTLPSLQEVEMLAVLNRASTTAIDLTGNQFDNMLLGNAGNNLLNGNAGADTMTGFGGDDTYVVDSQGDQVIESFGQGNDTLLTYVSYALSNGQEVEVLSTVANRDTTAIDLLGNDYGNRLVGNFGDNYLNGRGGADTMVGLRGNDTYVIDNAGDQLVENPGEGNDQAFTFVSYALAAGQEIEALSTANQRGTGGLSLTGNEYGQTLTGDFGNNLLDGQGGADTLVGLGGADTFAFTTALGSGNVDTILDFEVGADKIALSRSVFGSLLFGGLPTGAFQVGTAAQDADDRIIYNASSGALYYDADGSGAGAAIHFATLQPALQITAADFIVV